ncbi:helix-turn-helix domain-containing protein [Dyella monticola]|uniref:Helix-turn-helix domain-containing protein n=1 Tax=Dyella monticola TaxID=1927958 RepID=A0A370X1J6_9GAMM|nr:helix-turn-helix domain-containing protein [Dyella monticola]RDS82284.1 helix-turn-helix domain-containing protein [Dyella monticola]
MRISVLALEGVFDTGLTTVLDALAMANRLAQWNGISTPGFDVSLVGVRPEVHTGLGLQVPVRKITDTPNPDCVIVPAIAEMTAETLLPALGREDVMDAFGALRSWHSTGARLAAACTGTFVLAESGLLAGSEATTTWWLSPIFRQRYPDVRLNAHRIVVPSGAMVTAGAALSHLDLALWLIRGNSPELAALVAKYLVFDSRLSQTGFVISDQLVHSDPLVEHFDRWVRERLDSPLTLDSIAEALGASKRTLSRRLDSVLGKTPLEFIQDLRIERAVHLLKTTKHSVDQIAERVGYGDGVTLRTLLRRRLGKGIRELRSVE